MARYSREQRRCAVELYERYEHSAADVIRELGYPSKEALLMWYREWLEERRTGVPSRRGERYARYTDEQKRAAVDHYLTHGRRLSRTMRRMGYPSHEVLAAWIDELAPGERVIRRGPVADGVRRMAVARLAAGGVTSRQVAAEVGVEASVVRNWKRQLLHEPVPEDDPVTPDKPGKRNDGAADPDASDLDGLIAERDRVRAELERIRREKREAEIELAILKGALELVGKERGADPDNLTNREKTILVRTIGAGHGVPVGRLLARVGLARSTYYHQLNAMNRPDRVWTIRCCFGWMWRRRAWTRRTARSWRSGCVGRIRVWTVSTPVAYAGPVDGFIERMHGPNGLLAACARPGAPTSDEAARLARAYVASRLSDGVRVLAAGASVRFDRDWLDTRMPGVLSGVHHRSLDVSALDEAARMWAPLTWAARPERTTDHRVDSCLDDELRLAAYYRDAFRGVAYVG